MRKLMFVAAALSAGLFAGPAVAQKEKESAGPAVEVRVRSVNDLVTHVEYLGGVINKPEEARQAAEFVRGLGDPKKGIEGVDPDRPFGLYAAVTKDVVDSPVVVLIPLADEDAFLDLLRGKLSLDPKKGDGGVYSLEVPNFPAPVYFRFANKYVYATLQTDKGIDKAGLVDPATFFAGKEDAVLAARVHLDRIPADVRKTVLGQFELKVNDAKGRDEPNETKEEKKLRAWGWDQVLAAADAVATDGQELSLRLLIDPKTDDITTEVRFAARPGTPLAKAVAGLDGRSGALGALPAGPDALAAFGFKLGLTDDATKALAPVLDDLVAAGLDKSKNDVEKNVARMVADAVLPTLKAGEVDFGAVVLGPDADGHVAAIAAVKVAEGGKIEKTVKTFAPFAPPDQAKFEFDVEKVAGFTLHKVTVGDENVQKAFGTKTVWLGTSDTLILASVEPDGKLIRAAAKQKPGKVQVATVEGSAAKLTAVTEKVLPGDAVKAAAEEAFGKGGAAGADRFALTVTGGDAVTLKLTTKGKAVKFGVLLDEARKK